MPYDFRIVFFVNGCLYLLKILPNQDETHIQIRQKRPIYSGLKKIRRFQVDRQRGQSDQKWSKKLCSLDSLKVIFWRIVPWYNNPQTTIFRENIFWEKTCPSIKRNEHANPFAHITVFKRKEPLFRLIIRSQSELFFEHGTGGPWRRGPRKRTARGFPVDGWGVWRDGVKVMPKKGEFCWEQR